MAKQRVASSRLAISLRVLLTVIALFLPACGDDDSDNRLGEIAKPPGYNLTPQDSVDTFVVEYGAVSRDGGTVAGFIQRKDHYVTPGIWLAQGSLLEIAPGVIGRTKCVSPDGSVAGGGNGDEGAAFIWDMQVGFRNLMLHLQALDRELGTRYLDAFATTGTPADVTGIAADNKRLVGTAGQVAMSDSWSAFLLDLPAR